MSFWNGLTLLCLISHVRSTTRHSIFCPPPLPFPFSTLPFAFATICGVFFCRWRPIAPTGYKQQMVRMSNHRRAIFAPFIPSIHVNANIWTLCDCGVCHRGVAEQRLAYPFDKLLMIKRTHTHTLTALEWTSFFPLSLSQWHPMRAYKFPK